MVHCNNQSVIRSGPNQADIKQSCPNLDTVVILSAPHLSEKSFMISNSGHGGRVIILQFTTWNYEISAKN